MIHPSRWLPWQRLRHRTWALKRVGRALRWFVPMTRDVLAGRYRPVPWGAFVSMGLALTYLVMPLDLIPDLLLVVGLFDDVLIVGWLLTRVDRHLTDYRRWREAEDALREAGPS